MVMSQDIKQQLTSQIMEKAAVLRGLDRELAFRRQRLAAAHATQAVETTKARELLLQKTELETRCAAACSRVEIKRCDLKAARHELMLIRQQEKESDSQIEAVHHFYKDEFDRLDQQLQQQQEQHASPILILRTTMQREHFLYYLCADLLQRSCIKFDEFDQKAAATRARISVLDQSVAQLQQKHLELDLQLAAPDVALEDLMRRLTGRQRVRLDNEVSAAKQSVGHLRALCQQAADIYAMFPS